MCDFTAERESDKNLIRFLWPNRHNNVAIRNTIRNLCNEVRRSYQYTPPTPIRRLYLLHVVGA